MDTITEFLGALVNDFVDPNNRVFLGYLIPAFVIGGGVFLVGSGWKLRAAVAAGRRSMFSRSVWWSPSARGDYKAFAVHHALLMAVGPRLVAWMTLTTALYAGLAALLGEGAKVLAWPDWLVALMFMTCLMLCDDAAKYLLHRLYHRWPPLWALHKVHHSAEVLNPLTIYRFHPVERILAMLRGTTVYSAVLALFIFVFGDGIGIFTVAGVNALMFAFNATGANLRHMHVRLSYGPVLERLFISPAQHQIHHSVEERHYDKNFGVMLAIWDWLGGSLYLAEKGAENLRYGLNEDPGKERHSLYALLIAPMVEAGQVLVSARRREPAAGPGRPRQG